MQARTRLLLLVAVMLASLSAAGQKVCVRGYGLYDYYYATGAVGGAAATVDWRIDSTYQLSLGMEYASSNRYAANLEGRAVLCGKPNKQLCLVNRYLWRHYSGLDRQEFTGVLELASTVHHFQLELGLCNRYIASLVQRADGGNASVLEPMNVLFAAEGWLHEVNTPFGQQAQDWNVGLRWSNNNDFVIERVANWFFSCKGYYAPSDHCRLTVEVGTHPVGSLNLTASYNGWFCHLGGGYVF